VIAVKYKIEKKSGHKVWIPGKKTIVAEDALLGSYDIC
jgi:hypothetical protein